MTSSSSAASTSGSEDKDKKQVKQTTPQKTLGKSKPLDLGNFTLEDLKPETFDQIRAIIDSANSLMTEEERKYNEEKKRKEIEKNKKFDNAMENACKNEVFEVPRGSSKVYNFIGYSNAQYKEIMETGNKADELTQKERMSTKYLELEEEVYKKMVKYSLEGITDDVIDKLPRRELTWLYLVMKEKNENPLPFEVNA
jgi:hypothetical protein